MLILLLLSSIVIIGLIILVVQQEILISKLQHRIERLEYYGRRQTDLIRQLQENDYTQIH